METKEVQIGTMEKQLAHWGEKLDELAAKVTAAGTLAKAEEQVLVAELRVKQLHAQAKLTELKSAGADKWDGFKAGVESAYKELEGAFKSLGKN
ncbi:MAG: coiled coil domain-containing protein [Deltaproteobacteria bacterium]|nr:coiled coil domain-containing protein [Deltaproteobacteria bacterium]